MLLGLSVQAPGRETGFEQRSGKRRPRNGQVVRVRLADGALLQASAMPDTSEALLGQPSGLATCAGRLFVADADKNRVHVLDAKTLKPPAELSTTEAVIGENILSRPHGVAISPRRICTCATLPTTECAFSRLAANTCAASAKTGVCLASLPRRSMSLPARGAFMLQRANAYRCSASSVTRCRCLLPGLNLVRGLALSAETARHQRLLVSAGRKRCPHRTGWHGGSGSTMN